MKIRNLSINPVKREKSEYLIINFAKNQYSLRGILNGFGTNKKPVYDFYKPSMENSQISISDYLSWGLCGLNIPFLYHADSLSQIIDNKQWFEHRKGKEDILLDAQKSYIYIDDILKLGNIEKVDEDYMID